MDWSNGTFAGNSYTYSMGKGMVSGLDFPLNQSNDNNLI
jgi:hypothetical protein